MDRDQDKPIRGIGTPQKATEGTTMITTQLNLERCLCKNSDGTYNIFEALRYNNYTISPHLLWELIQSEYAFMFDQIRFYFFSDELATDQDGINLILELARRIQFG